MRKRQFHFISLLIVAGSLFNSCILENSSEYCPECREARLRVQLAGAGRVDTPDPPATKSGETSPSSFSESSVADLHAAVYNSSGELTGRGYSSGGSVTVTTRSGTGCTVYALVNTGNESMVIPALEADMQEMTTGKLATPEDIRASGNLFMSGSLATDIAAGENTIGSFSVSRLAARNILNITCTGGIALTGYTMRDLPVKSWYVARPNAGEAEVDDETMGFDAVDPDIETDWVDSETLPASGIATGSSTYSLMFYQYENRRGGRIAVGGTTGDMNDQAQKAIYAPPRATHVELHVDAGGTAITYKFYLGANACTNYNVKRNCSYTYNISIGATGMSISGIGIEDWTEISGGETTL